MIKDERRGGTTVGIFEAGGEFGPTEDRDEYKQRLDALPAEENELAELCARFADICRYFAEKKIDIPALVLDMVDRLSRSSVRNRIRILKDANQRLIGFLNDVGKDPKIRQ